MYGFVSVCSVYNQSRVADFLYNNYIHATLIQVHTTRSQGLLYECLLNEHVDVRTNIMEYDSSFYPEIANGDNRTIKDEKLSGYEQTIARVETAMGQATKRSGRKSRKNYVPVKIARIESEASIKENGYISDESDDYDVNVVNNGKYLRSPTEIFCFL